MFHLLSGINIMKPILYNLPYQHGAALITGLIFLVILTLLGITAMRTSTLEERIAGNTRDRNVAFQAGDTALRDGERDIMNICEGSYCRAVSISGRTGFDENCTNGLCYKAYPPGFTTPVWKDNAFGLNKGQMAGEAPSVEYGAKTSGAKIEGLAQDSDGNLIQPRYLIEVFRKWPPGESNWRDYYRITTRAVGGNITTQVLLQEVFLP